MGAYGIAGGMSQIALFTGIYLVICLGSIACWAYAGSRLQGWLVSPAGLRWFNRAMALSCCSAPPIWCARPEGRAALCTARGGGHPAFELALEVGPIGKTAGRPLPPGAALAQQGAGVANALIEQVGVGRHAVVAAEGAHEVGRVARPPHSAVPG